MSDQDDTDLNHLEEAAAEYSSILPPDEARPTSETGWRAPEELSRLPTIVLPTLRAERIDQPRVERPKRSNRLRFAAAASFALLGAGIGTGAGVYVMNDHRHEAGLLAAHEHQTEALARTVDALNARLSTIESTKSHDELVELRRSVGEIKSVSASSHELSAALAQLSQRVERLDREAAAKVDKLGERFDRDTSAQAAELTARIEKLEKKTIAVAAPAAPSPPATTSLQAKQPAGPPKFGPNVSMETTGSIERPRPLLRRYVVLGAREDVALVEGRDGERAVRPGDVLPGAGRVERIERSGDGWVVLTDQGLIPAAEPY
jgi:hypothetical protein